MTSLALIAEQIGTTEPDLDMIYEYLEEQGKPVAVEKKPLIVIAPVANRLHARARTLEFELGAIKDDPIRYSASATRAFSEITDMYLILSGIAAPDDSSEREEFLKEKLFARKLLDISFRLLKELGANDQQVWDPFPLREESKKSYVEELESLRKAYPFPEFALEHNMARRRTIGGTILLIVIFAFILEDMGIIRAIIEFFRGR